MLPKRPIKFIIIRKNSFPETNFIAKSVQVDPQKVAAATKVKNPRTLKNDSYYGTSLFLQQNPTRFRKTAKPFF